jgi:hypothetical protein
VGRSLLELDLLALQPADDLVYHPVAAQAMAAGNQWHCVRDLNR